MNAIPDLRIPLIIAAVALAFVGFFSLVRLREINDENLRIKQENQTLKQILNKVGPVKTLYDMETLLLPLPSNRETLEK